MKTTKKYTVTFTDRHVEIIRKIQEKDGAPTVSGALHIALAFWRQKTEPHYLNQGAIVTGKTPEERAKEAVDLKMAKENRTKEIKFNAKKHICENILGGEVFKDATGGFSCRYNVHHATSEDEEQVLPLDIVNESYGQYQFFPSREKVLEVKPHLRQKFERK